MSSVRLCVILLVALMAMTRIAAAAEPDANQLRQKGRELQMKADKLRSEGRLDDANEVAQDADRTFRRADEVARQRGPEGDPRRQGDRGPQGPHQPQSGISTMMEAIGRQVQAAEGYITELRGRGMGDRAEQVQRDVNQLRENLERIERSLREGQPGMPGPGPQAMSPGPGPTPSGSPGMPYGGPGMPGGPQGQPGGPPGMSAGPQGMPMGPGPQRQGPEPQMDHLQKAIRHINEAVGELKAAGIHDLAEKLARESDRLQREAGPSMEKDELHRTVRKLSDEIGQLRSEMNELRRRIDQRR